MSDELTFKVYNKPCKTFIQLKQQTLVNHVVNDHSNRNFLLINDNVKSIAKNLEHIDTFVKDSKHGNRKNYYSPVFLKSSADVSSRDLRVLKVVTEPIANDLEDIVTIFPIRKESSIDERDIVYMEWKDDGIQL